MRDRLREAVPPPIRRRVRSIVGRFDADRAEGVEKGSEWYDGAHDRSSRRSRHYTESEYYFLWSVIADRLASDHVDSVLEIACGTGQLARLLEDRGVTSYCGFDFSAKGIDLARRDAGSLRFEEADAFETDLYGSVDFDAVICTEFLEHVERDLEVFDRLPEGTRFIGSVPNFPYTSHVRHFASVDEVADRYQSRLQPLRVDPFRSTGGRVFYLMDGIVRQTSSEARE